MFMIGFCFIVVTFAFTVAFRNDVLHARMQDRERRSLEDSMSKLGRLGL
jgi:hypothetical protein